MAQGLERDGVPSADSVRCRPVRGVKGSPAGSRAWPRDRVKGKCGSPAGTCFPHPPALRAVSRTLGNLLMLLIFHPGFVVDFSGISTVKHAEWGGHQGPYSPHTNPSRTVPWWGAGGPAGHRGHTEGSSGLEASLRSHFGRGRISLAVWIVAVTCFPVPGLWLT